MKKLLILTLLTCLLCSCSTKSSDSNTVKESLNQSIQTQDESTVPQNF